jgi:hypothetical protein
MVGYSSSTGKYQATLSILGKLIFLGEYKSYKEAKMAEKAATRETDDYFRGHLNRTA